MRLATRLALKTSALLVGLVLIGAAALWGLIGLGSSFDAATDEYEQLRTLYQVGHHASTAALLLRTEQPDSPSVRLELSSAIGLTQQLIADPTLAPQRRSLTTLQTLLRAAQSDLLESLDLHRTTIRTALAQVADVAQQVQQQIVATRQAAADRLHTTILALSALFIAVVTAGLAVAISQYRSVIGPLRRLERGVTRLAAGDFSGRLPVEGDKEFAHLAGQFNQMAAELQTLYGKLEQQVNEKSRQLVQSQRLAGVGYLAAGLAHEINNPLAIIVGYAEAALKELPPDDGSRAARALRVVAEEAFRCKQITSKLLSLARPDSSTRAEVDLPAVLDRVTTLMAGLPQFHRRKVELVTRGDLTVIGNEAELTQVFINLIANALEAVDEGAGRVNVEAERRGPWVVVRVIDNGRGMTEETAGRVFEPFFTDKPQRDQRGIGLGLPVSHAIVTQHGGRIAAASDGPGRGSVLTIELPAADGQADAAEAKDHGTTTR